MTSFDTDYIWDALSEDGKIVTSAILAAEYAAAFERSNEELRELLAAQLNAEAKDEGVSLRINRCRNYDDLLHVYLRKGN